MKVYHLKACDTCRKAIKALQSAGHDLDLHDVRGDGLNVEVVEALEVALGYETLVNKRSTTWRGLEDGVKANLDRTTAISLLMEHPTLMKRPVIQSGEEYTIGWTKDVQAKYGL